MLNKEKVLEKMKVNVQENAEAIISACENVLIFRAEEKAIIDLVCDIQTKILKENCFYIAIEYVERAENCKRAKNGRILKPFDACFMSDDDFQKFLNLCYSEYVKNGIAHPQGKEYCPEAPFQDKRIKEENNLLDLWEQVIGNDIIPHEDFIQMRQHWKYREQLLDLALNMINLETLEEK